MTGGTPDAQRRLAAADAGVHQFAAVFNTAGSQTVTVTDTETPAFFGTSSAVSVAETLLVASFSPGSVVQGSPESLTLSATDGNGERVTGYQGTVQLASSFGSVAATSWGGGAQNGLYSFTASDGGQHVFTPAFSDAGSETAQATDQARAGRTASATATVTSAPAGAYSHTAAPAGLTLADGSTLWAVLDATGRLYVRRNVGTLTEPAWRPIVTVRQENAGGIGADTPSLALLGSTVALFHSYPDSSGILQVWLTTSSDSGATWSAPVQLSHGLDSVQRIQTAVVSGALCLFWSQQDTSGRLVGTCQGQ